MQIRKLLFTMLCVFFVVPVQAGMPTWETVKPYAVKGGYGLGAAGVLTGASALTYWLINRKLRKMRNNDFASFTRRLAEAERRLALTPWDKFEAAAHDQTNAMRRVLSQETQQKLMLFTKMLDQLEGSRRSIEDQIRAAREELEQVRTFVGELAQEGNGKSFMKELMSLKERTFGRLKELEKDKQAMQANKEELERALIGLSTELEQQTTRLRQKQQAAIQLDADMQDLQQFVTSQDGLKEAIQRAQAQEEDLNEKAAVAQLHLADIARSVKEDDPDKGA